VHDVTDVQILKHYVSDADSISVFRQEAHKMLCPLDQAILGHCVKKNRRSFSEDGSRAGFRRAVIQCLYICKIWQSRFHSVKNLLMSENCRNVLEMFGGIYLGCMIRSFCINTGFFRQMVSIKTPWILNTTLKLLIVLHATVSLSTLAILQYNLRGSKEPLSLTVPSGCGAGRLQVIS
jgi:hypothetical protein